MERATRGVWLSVAALVVMAVACSAGDPGSDDANGTTVPAVSLPPTSVVEGGGTTTVVEAPVTFPPDADAKQVVAELGPRLPMSDAERRCVVQALGSDDDLLSRLAEGVSPGTELFDEIAVVHQRCTVSVTQAPMFAASLNERAGGSLTPEQLSCLSDGFAALGPDALDAALVAALNPADPSSESGSDPLTGLVAGCGVEVPA